jgi:hypothetical protein
MKQLRRDETVFKKRTEDVGQTYNKAEKKHD